MGFGDSNIQAFNILQVKPAGPLNGSERVLLVQNGVFRLGDIAQVAALVEIGAKGDKGDKGADGLTVLHGVASPSNDVGSDGDFYVDASAWNIFGPKVSGVWPAGVAMIQKPDMFYTKAQSDNLVAAHETQTFRYDTTTGLNTFAAPALINMALVGVYRSGMRFNVITNGAPAGNQVLFDASTGRMTFADNFSTDYSERIYIDYKSASFDPTIPDDYDIIDGNG